MSVSHRLPRFHHVGCLSRFKACAWRKAQGELWHEGRPLANTWCIHEILDVFGVSQDLQALKWFHARVLDFLIF